MTRSSRLLSPRLEALDVAVAAGDATAVDVFWREIEAATTPLIEPDPANPKGRLVTFLWRAVEPLDNVLLLEWLTGGDLPDKRMTRLRDTDVWYRTLRMRSDVRSVYRFAPNDSLVSRTEETDWAARRSTWVMDPLNPKRFLDEAEVSDDDRPWLAGSILELPDAPRYPWTESRIGTPQGGVQHHRFASATLENERDLWVYTPSPVATGGRQAGLLILFDGDRSLHALEAPAQLDRLIAEGAIPPLIAVLVGNVDRGNELPCNPAFGRFLADELVPWVRSRHDVSRDPAETILAGQSYGGLAAVYHALERPDLFGNALSQSGSFWWKPDPLNSSGPVVYGDAPDYGWICREAATRPTAPVRIFMEAGTMEDQPIDDHAPSLLGCHRHMRDVLTAKEYEVTYREYPGGHDYIWWRGLLADGLISLVGSPSPAN